MNVLSVRNADDPMKVLRASLQCMGSTFFPPQAVKCSDHYSVADLRGQIPSAFLMGYCKNL